MRSVEELEDTGSGARETCFSVWVSIFNGATVADSEEGADRERAEAQRCPRGAAGDLGGPATVRDASSRVHCSKLDLSSAAKLQSLARAEFSSSRV